MDGRRASVLAVLSLFLVLASACSTSEGRGRPVGTNLWDNSAACSESAVRETLEGSDGRVLEQVDAAMHNVARSFYEPDEGCVRVLELLLAVGGDPSGVDVFGNTVLSNAVIRGQSPEFIEMLLDAGADPCVPVPVPGDTGPAEDGMRRLIVNAESDVRTRLEAALTDCPAVR